MADLVEIIPEKSINYYILVQSFITFYILIFIIINYIYVPIVYSYLKLSPCNYDVHYSIISYITIFLNFLLAYFLGSVLSEAWVFLFTILSVILFCPTLIFLLYASFPGGRLAGVEEYQIRYDGSLGRTHIQKCASYCPNIIKGSNGYDKCSV